MYTKANYSFKDMLMWTRRDIYRFLFIAIVPVMLYSVFDFKFLHLPWLPIALVGTAVAFVVSFKNNASYGRLWEARKVWGGIVNGSRSWGIMVNDFITNEHAQTKLSEEELAAIKKKMVKRHIAWMTAHRYALRETKSWEVFLNNKSNAEYSEKHPVYEKKYKFEDVIADYLDEDEQAYIAKKTNKATHILSLQSKHLKALKQQGLIWEFSHLEMENMLVEFYTLQGKNERIKNFPYPRQFATLNYFFVWIFIFLLPFGIMEEFDAIGASLLELSNGMKNNVLQICYKTISEHFVWLTVPFSIIISWVFHTMERIGEVSENPFEGNANDIPITTMSRAIEIDMLEMLDETDLPEPVPMVYDIQM